jgi:hypothetical protein
MSDDGALSGAMMLSQQLEMYRWMDALERARNNKELAVDNALLRHESEQIVARYNHLVTEFNDLLRRTTEVAKEAERKDGVIAELGRANAALESECDRLRRENHTKATEIELLRNIVRRDHPDMYLPDC